MSKGTVNKVILLGRLGNDPEIRTTANGTIVANISIATNDGVGEDTHTEWHRVVLFGKTADIIQKYAKKGSQIFLEGRLRTSKWDKNGVTQYKTEIIANNFQFINNKRNDDQLVDNLNSSPSKQEDKKEMPDFSDINSSNFDDDIPF